MAKLDHRAAWLLFGILAMMALLSFGQGLVHALGSPRPEAPAAGVDPSRDPIPRASALSGPVLDELRVREIAREEANAAVGAVRKKAAAAASKPAAADEDGAAPMTTTPSAPSSPVPAPAAATPPPAAPPG